MLRFSICCEIFPSNDRKSPPTLHPAGHDLSGVDLPVHPGDVRLLLVLAEHEQADDEDGDQDHGEHDGDDQADRVLSVLFDAKED